MKGRIGAPPTISNFIYINGIPIPKAIFADCSHLVKLIRNCLQNHKVIRISKKYQDWWGLTTNEIRWDVIEAVVKFQEEHELLIGKQNALFKITPLGDYTDLKL